MGNSKYSYSLNDDEYFNGEVCESREAAIKGAIEAAKYMHVTQGTAYIGVAVEFKARIDAEQIIDIVVDQASQEVPDIGDYLEEIMDDDMAELEDALQAAWDKWEKKHIEYRPRFYIIRDVEEFDIEGLLKSGGTTK